MEKIICRLRECRLAVRLAAVTQGDAKDVRLSTLSIGSDHRRAGAEIDLSFHSRSAFHAAERKRCCCAQPPDKPLHAVVAAREAMLVNEVLPDSLGREPLIELGQN